MYCEEIPVNTKGNNAFCTVSGMAESEKHTRLREARLKAGFRSASEAARRFGWTDSAYRHHENGTRGFSAKTAERYARAYRVPVDWIVFGNGSSKKRPVPLVGIVGAGAEVFPIDDGGSLDEIDPMPGLGPEAVAVRVVGDSMYPRYFDGDILVYDQHVSMRDAHGQECVVALADGRRLIKVVRLRNGVVSLESYNHQPIEDADIEWAAPVLWVRRS
ncbi:MAG: helix-turn-helix transcriptional regulator [Rhodobacteraceae bacterium]|nr:helix-turn-helix transcriptional regulator [Paracoccaceae bacterium]MBR9823052.1 helix-turn-helix transcriptional regulator [Paracoccaceae bacterium]